MLGLRGVGVEEVSYGGVYPARGGSFPRPAWFELV